MIIAGIDISKSSIMCCLISSKPEDVKDFFYQYEFIKLQANTEGIKKLLSLNVDVAIIEPTGTNYSKLWGTHLARAGVEVRLVDHKGLRLYRESLQLPDKNDEADSLALACYGCDYLNSSKRFLQIRDKTTVRVRELTLRIAHLARAQSPIINRLRQDLSWQFPEVANSRSRLTLWQWIAGVTESKKYDNLYSQSCGLGLTEFSRSHAKRLLDIWSEEETIDTELKTLLDDPRFVPYIKVFDQFRFGTRIKGVLISQIFPLENFLKDGKPEVIIKKGRRSGKQTKRHLSLRRFQKSLGLAPTESSSGDKKSQKIIGGSDLCRKAFWQWVFTMIEVAKNRPKNDIGDRLGAEMDNLKKGGTPIKLVRMAIASKACRYLFRELVKAIVQ